MRASVLLAAFSALTATATLVERQRDCQALYKTCIASGKREVVCSCDLATCSGEDNARTRDYCAQQTGASGTTSAPTITGTAGSQPSGQPAVTAAAGSLKLGEACSDDRQCAGEANCWGSNAGIIRRCGNFNAACKVDSQCAYNTCNNGLCNGFKNTATGGVAAPTGTTGANTTCTSGCSTATKPGATQPVRYDGAATRSGVQAGAAVAVAAVLFAWAL